MHQTTLISTLHGRLVQQVRELCGHVSFTSVLMCKVSDMTFLLLI